MKTTIIWALLFSFVSLAHGQQIWVSRQAFVSFYSSTPLENIKGTSTTATSAIDLATGELIFNVKNTSFQFKKKLMQEHFNENYMESDQYPVSSFKGKIENVIQLQKDGVYQVPVAGTLNVHGVTKNYRTQASLTVANGTIKAETRFTVKTADHGIKIPSIVISNIAEELEITVSATYQVNQIKKK